MYDDLVSMTKGPCSSEPCIGDCRAVGVIIKGEQIAVGSNIQLKIFPGHLYEICSKILVNHGLYQVFDLSGLHEIGKTNPKFVFWGIDKGLWEVSTHAHTL